jgi:hypothetical protein
MRRFHRPTSADQPPVGLRTEASTRLAELPTFCTLVLATGSNPTIMHEEELLSNLVNPHAVASKAVIGASSEGEADCG